MMYLDAEPGALGGPCPTRGCGGIAVAYAEEERESLGARCPYRCGDCVSEMDSARLPDIGPRPDLFRTIAFGIFLAAAVFAVLFALAALSS